MSLAGKSIALTGALASMSRSEFKAAVKGAGATYRHTTQDDTDLLVVGDRPLRNRVDAAAANGVEIIDEQGFTALLSGAPMPVSGGEVAADPQQEVPLAFEKPEDAPISVAPVRDGQAMRVLDVVLPVRQAGALTPSVDLFHHYTLDGRTLAMLRFIARAVRLRQPCLLEGDTATSKTSAVQYLAALTGNQVVRINLNGQTDTSELVGRYVPNDEDLGVDVADLLDHLDLLEAESRQILERMRDQGRELTAVERQQIAANERMERPQWRFMEGLIPRAMREGWWIILDEVNLAEPAVLERMNSVLERQPNLVLTEGPGTRFGPGGDVEVHPDFRIFATMNPAEYQGRSVLSPAYKDRWVATWQASSPGEVEYRQMLERVVFGRQPDVEVNGLYYAGAQGLRRPYAKLADVPNIGDFLSRLAMLHAGLVRMASPADGKPASLGASRRERYVFSRRGLLAVLDGLAVLELADPKTGEAVDIQSAPETLAIDALERTYLDKVRGEDDRGRVVQLLRSLGLHRGHWLQQMGDGA